MISTVNNYAITTTNMLNITAAETAKSLSDLDHEYVPNHCLTDHCCCPHSVEVYACCHYQAGPAASKPGRA